MIFCFLGRFMRDFLFLGGKEEREKERKGGGRVSVFFCSCVETKAREERKKENSGSKVLHKLELCLSRFIFRFHGSDLNKILER